MKLTHIEGNPKIKFYRNYKNVHNALFQVNLENALRNFNDSVCTNFEEAVLRALQSFTKYFRLTLVFMQNSALQEKFNFFFSGVFASINKICILG